ncbi:MAG: WYL domain-containing protein [Clostridia bacterium]|nr:WYL domain-containing protein [Clostridia bacterium]
MIFNEIHSAYYSAVSKIISRILEGGASEEDLRRIVAENAFGESGSTLLPALTRGKWQLVHPDLSTPVKNPPQLPLTLIEKQWLKALFLDPRIRLFSVEPTGLEGVEPLFTPEDYLIYDRYGDGDRYEDEGYIARFRTVLSAMEQGDGLQIEMIDRRGRTVCFCCMPKRLEYSERDDKFRLITQGSRFYKTVNLGRMVNCRTVERALPQEQETPPVYRTLTLHILKERNTPERCLLHFAHFEKRAERQEDGSLVVHLRYDVDEEPEMVIRVLSFGPLVEVLAPQDFRNLIAERLKKQKSCGLF